MNKIGYWIILIAGLMGPIVIMAYIYAKEGTFASYIFLIFFGVLFVVVVLTMMALFNNGDEYC